MMNSILIVEDDRDLNQFVQEVITDNGFSVQVAYDGTSALDLIHRTQPALVVLDLNLPDINGESICQEIKKNYPEIYVIILTAKHTTAEIVHGLNLGADDYITKPFAGDELIARIKARLRQTSTGDRKLKVGDLELDPRTLEVRRKDQLINLTQTEFQLLEYLMANPGRVLTRDMILNRVWSYSPDTESRVVDVYIGYLRKKIDRGFTQKLIHSIRGFGYTIKEE